DFNFIELLLAATPLEADHHPKRPLCNWGTGGCGCSSNYGGGECKSTSRPVLRADGRWAINSSQGERSTQTIR
uniref:NRXN1 n=1 Tax=Macrostomum lignano TaxID=282301 RepID=A0A1I8IBD7_9PLAT